MAKRKKAKKTTSKRRGRFGGLSLNGNKKEALMLIAGGIAGVLVKRLGENALNSQTAVTINPKLLFAGELVVGGLAVVMAKNPFIRGAGIGIAAASGVQLAQQMKVLNGIGEVPAGLIRFSNTNIAGATITPSVGAVKLNPYGYPSAQTVGKTRLKMSQRFAGAGL